ncbi:hypothetical protein [Bradyrhizobium sp.]
MGKKLNVPTPVQGMMYALLGRTSWARRAEPPSRTGRPVGPRAGPVGDW